MWREEPPDSALTFRACYFLPSWSSKKGNGDAPNDTGFVLESKGM